MKKVNSSMNIQRACKLFNIPLSSYYKALEAAVINPKTDTIITRMLELDEEHLHCLGRRRMHNELLKEGFEIGSFKVARLMKDAGIIAKIPKKAHYYPAGNEKPDIPNILKRQFNPVSINTHWVGDITYIRNYQGWSYLATVLDLHTREIVGYALSKTPDAELAKKALMNAISFIKPDTKKLMFHSDQGVQYNANLFKDCLSLHGITQSMSRRGNCWDNAVQERFFRSLKSEYLNGLSFINHDAVIHATVFYIRYYNNKRPHSSLGYNTPAETRRDYKNVA